MKIRLPLIRTVNKNIMSFDISMYSQYFALLFLRDKGNAYDVYDVDVELPRKNRSTGKHSQSAHLNGHVQQIAVETGQDFDSTKMAIKLRACDMGYPCIYNKAGDRIPQSEKFASVSECSLLIEAAHIVATELDIKLQDGEK